MHNLGQLIKTEDPTDIYLSLKVDPAKYSSIAYRKDIHFGNKHYNITTNYVPPASDQTSIALIIKAIVLPKNSRFKQQLNQM